MGDSASKNIRWGAGAGEKGQQVKELRAKPYYVLRSIFQAP